MPVVKRSVNSFSKDGSTPLKGDVTISEGTGITLTQTGQDIEIASTGGGGGGTVDSVVAGSNIDVDSTDPANPIVSVETLTLADISDVTASVTEVNYIDGVTSSIQTQLDGKVDENAGITGATKTKITYDAKGLVTGGADATTADIADSSNKRYVTDAQLTVIGNTSGTNTGDQNLSSYVVGPASATDNAVVRFDSTTGKLVKDSTVTISTGANPTIASTGVNLVLAAGSGAVLYSGSEVVNLSGTQTISGKTLTAPRIANAGFIADANGNEQIIFTTTASAVNEVTHANAATGNAPSITASGGDANINLSLAGKGTGEPVIGGNAILTTSNTKTLSNKSISGLINTLTNLPVDQLTTSTSFALGVGTIELGHASDTTLSRASAGRLAVEGVNVVTISSTDTLTNKTLTSPIISSISNTGTLTLPTSTDTLVGRATTDTLTNKTITAASNTFSDWPNVSVASVFPFASASTSSTSYVNVPSNSIATTFTKRFASSKLVVHIDLGYYLSSAAGAITIGVNIASTDYDVGKRYRNEVAASFISGTAAITGISAGSVTATVRVKTSAGTINFDSNFSGSITVTEAF